MAALMTEIGQAQMLLRLMEDVAQAKRVQFRVGDVDHDVTCVGSERGLSVSAEMTVDGDGFWVIVDGDLRYFVEAHFAATDQVTWNLRLPVAA